MKIKHTILLLVIALWFLTGTANAFVFTPQKVAPNVYAFIGDTGMRTYENAGMNANAGFIVTAQGVVVVDSGSSYLVAKAMHQAIKHITTQPVKYVINTGGQDHRWLGNSYFKEIGAEIISSSKALADMQDRGAAELTALQPELKDKFTGTRATYPTHLINKMETLKLGGEDIQILYFYGGHTPGDNVVWLPSKRILFSGDLIFVDRMLGIWPFSNTRDWLASFAEIEKLQPLIIVPGHGQVCDIARAQHDTRDYLLLLRNHMRKAIDDGVDLQTAVDTLDQSAYSYLKNFQLLSGGNANRTYLEVESE
ncbi:MBL fold metallo-hydrolase [Sulfuriferula nivalis]|uniref:MBL fold metallo-hydrolase n=1 Tax=Sulfuriferula nivalis TaxID=2675298 RepID=A0A809S831_9PROT|nr:MBL fold metallo-hydrolase [Sulfuriferula nivalis]BBP00213.1 MBL fold metallo-hydrolase [Sulfuriferula nivalis]